MTVAGEGSATPVKAADTRRPLVVYETMTSRSGAVEASSFLLVFIVSGQAIVRLTGGTVLAREGVVFALPRGTQGTHATPRSLRAVSWAVDDEFAAAHARWMPPAHPLSPAVRSATASPPRPAMAYIGVEGMRSIREPLLNLAALERHHFLTHYDRLSRTSQIFDLLDPRHHSATAPRLARSMAHLRPEISRAQRLMEESIAYPWSIRDLAASVALSPSQLSRLFRSGFGVSPGAYLWRRRIEVMAELLITSDITVTEAAQMAGWRSRSAASRAFRERYGMSPREFMKRNSGQLKRGDG